MNPDDDLRDDFLRARIVALPGTGGPPPEKALGRARDALGDRRRRRVGLVGSGAVALALAAAALLATKLPADMRDRGVVIPPLEVHLQAAAEGPRGVRPLTSGGAVARDERVLFEVHVSGDGYLALDGDRDGRVWPSGEAWSVRSGVHVVGGDRMLSYRPDALDAGSVTYVAWLCETPPSAGERQDCAMDRLVLTWSP